MFCRKCGTKIDDDSNFCFQCGNMISAPQAEQPFYNNKTEEPVQPVQDDDNSSQSDNNDYTVVNDTNSDRFYNHQDTYSNYNSGYNNVNFNKPITKSKTGFAVASLIISILSLPSCCCNIYVPFTPILPILSILSIIFGIIGLKSRLKGLAITGIIIGGIGILMYIVLLLFFYFTPQGAEFQNTLWSEFKRAMEESQYYMD